MANIRRHPEVKNDNRQSSAQYQVKNHFGWSANSRRGCAFGNIFIRSRKTRRLAGTIFRQWDTFVSARLLINLAKVCLIKLAAAKSTFLCSVRAAFGWMCA